MPQWALPTLPLLLESLGIIWRVVSTPSHQRHRLSPSPDSPIPKPYDTFSLGNQTYAQRATIHSLGSKYQNTGCLVSIVEVKPGDQVNSLFLQSIISGYLRDDVFRQEFLAGVIFAGAKRAAVTVDLDSSELMQTWGIQWFCFMEDTELPSQVPPGPYTIHQGQLYSVRRVYSDDKYGFFRGIWHSHRAHDDFLELQISGDRYRSLGVAIPSRIHSRPSKNTPLDGVRVAVKDNFDVCGLRTSVGSLPYYQLYPPSIKTAEAVEQLISMGADVVGKLSMSAFALMEHPMQSVDYQAPINPRGDGYQIPGGSSSGGGAAIASYEWLDLALVTDTTGSARIPALYNGCFGLRPSSGIIPMTNTKAVYLEFDTPGLMGRDLSLLHQVLQSWGHSESARNVSPGPFRVIFPRDFRSIASDEQLKLLDSFAGNLAKVLSAKVEEISIAADWAASPPEQSKSLDTFLHDINTHGFYYAAYHSFDEFRLDYIQKYGKPPFVTEVIRWIWELGKKVKPQENREALRRIKVFRDWFLQRYMSTATGNILFILPIGKVGPNYREQYPGLPAGPSTGLPVTSLSPSIGAPEPTVPIGEIQYHSRITENVETLPVMAGLMGMPSADIELVQVALNSLEKLGLPTKIQTDKSMFGEHSDGAFKVVTK